jgi:hypothetical protein
LEANTIPNTPEIDPGMIVIIHISDIFFAEFGKISYEKTSSNKLGSKKVIANMGKQNMKNIEPNIAPEILSEYF